jgi:hypothetical protein
MKNSDLQNDPDLKNVNEAYRLRTTDRIKSFLSLEEFAEKGSKVSLLYISDMFMRGVNLNDITVRSKHWNELAKKLHLDAASYRFGSGFYRDGDFPSAFDAFSWGASDGYAPSIYRLASMYLHGKFVEKDFKKARELLELAAQKGNVFAKKDLAHILLMKNFGISGKIKGFGLFCVLIFYQIDVILRRINKIPLDERYLH